MNEDAFNMSIRRFLKMVGVKSQHEIEQAVAKAIESGKIAGSEHLPAKMTLTLGSSVLNVSFDGVIELE